MESSTKILLTAAIFGAGAFFLWKKGHDDEEDTNEANRATANLDDPDTKAALLLKHALQYELVGPVWAGNDVESPPEIAALYNACLNVTNWAGVQTKFSTLCNNEATLLQAMQDNTDSNVFQTALNLCKAKKVISTEPLTARLTVFNEDGSAEDEGEGKQFAADTLLGAVITTTSDVVTFNNGFQSAGIVPFRKLQATNGTASINKVKIVDPLKP